LHHITTIFVYDKEKERREYFKMTVVEVTDQYLIMMAITLLFTVLAIAYRENYVLRLISSLCWLTSSAAHFAVGDKTSPLTSALSYLFLGFGLILISSMVIEVSKMKQAKRKEQYSLEL